MTEILTLAGQPATWVALITLVVLEIVLGIDNLVFISILANKLPEASRARVRQIGIGLALVMRLALLSTITWIVALTAPVVDLGLTGALDSHGEPSFETALSWRDLILMAGGLFLLWKATTEIHHSVDTPDKDTTTDKPSGKGSLTVTGAILQIVVLDLVFSIDSILTAVGMTDQLPIMIAAVVITVALMLVAAGPLGNFIAANPSVVMLALGFLLMIGMVLIAEALGVHIPKGYIYTAMGFSAAVEGLNIWSRNAKNRAPANNAQATPS